MSVFCVISAGGVGWFGIGVVVGVVGGGWEVFVVCGNKMGCNILLTDASNVFVALFRAYLNHG